MEAAGPVVYEENGEWRVNVLAGGRVQTYRCHSRQQAQRFAALFLRPVPPRRSASQRVPAPQGPTAWLRALLEIPRAPARARLSLGYSGAA